MAMITRTVNESLYDQFGMRRVSDEAALEAYGRLINVVEARNKLDRLVVATRNYDRAAESALRGLGFLPETGFAPESERSRWLDPSGLVERCADDPRVVPVLHLHGAVGWYEQQGRVYDRSGDQPINPTLGAPVVLYPDPDKDPTSDAAVDMLWREFRYALDHSTHVLVIGHSLNDPALVRVLGELPSDTSIGVTVLEGDDDSWLREKVPRALSVPARLGPELSISGAAVAAFSRARSESLPSCRPAPAPCAEGAQGHGATSPPSAKCQPGGCASR
jgi:hypothetical protein